MIRVAIAARTAHRRALAGAATVAMALFATTAAAQDKVADDSHCLLRQGQVRLALEGLEATFQRAEDGEPKARAAAALALAYLRLNRLDSAEPLLLRARAGLARTRERAATAIDLGQVYLAWRQPDKADAAWRDALEDAPGESDLALTVELNRLRLPKAARRLDRLEAASRQLDVIVAGAERARYALNIAEQAGSVGAAGTELALRMLQAALSLATAAGDEALAAQAYDGLGALYEQQQRYDEAMRLTERGLRHALRVQARELAITLEWRAGRLALRQGHRDLALAAYRRAVEHVEAVRADIPVQYLDGRSSFRETLEPVYLGLTDLLLQQSASASSEAGNQLLRQARDTVELIKQTELEDYLRGRCSVGSSLSERPFVLPPKTAIYYPIILPDRLELLVETARGIERQTVSVTGDVLRRAALEFVSALRAKGQFRESAERLYRWLIAPIETRLAEQDIHTLVAVPDGVLRLVPLAALHDGNDFLVKRLTLATVPGLSVVTAAPRREAGALRALVAGMSEPGPVLDKLPLDVVGSVLDSRSLAAAERGDTRSMVGSIAPAVAAQASAAEQSSARTNALREALSLPGVKRELANIAAVISGVSLLDKSFTLAALEDQLLTNSFPVVHIASHGVFGDSADTTFIMTFDELLTLDELQKLLAHERFRKQPIELITLSACQTAEGDDRAPLGMSGTAIKAHARSALGTLWPVSDEAAQQLMSNFYTLLAAGRHSKIGALRQAQIDLIANPAHRHPFDWAPFILIGDWQ